MNSLDINNKLLPCPFCGEDEDIAIEDSFVTCKSCAASVHCLYKTAKEMIKIWNTRVNLPNIEEIIVKGLTGKNKHFCPDWDGMAIDENCPEFESCTCKEYQ